MKKKHYLLLMGLMICALSQPVSAQKVWVPYIALKKNFSGGNGSVYNVVRSMDTKSGSLFLNGYWDQAMIYNVQGTAVVDNVLDSNTLKLSGGTWKSGGKISFVDRLSAVNAHDTLNGLDYIGVEIIDSHGVMATVLKVRDTVTNRYVPVPNLKFDAGVTGIHFLGNGKAYVFGNFYQGQDVNGIKVLEGEAFWDLQSGTLSAVSNPFYYSTLSGGQAESISDKTLIMFHGARARILHYGSATLQPVPQFPFSSGHMLAVAVKDKTEMYAAIQKDSIGFPCYLFKLVGNNWVSMNARFTLSTATASTPKDLNRVKSVEYVDGKLYIAGNFDRLNDQPIDHILVHNLATGSFTNLPNQPFTHYDQSHIKALDGKLYLIEDNSNIIFGEQRVYVLRETAIPVITGPTETQTQSVIITGTVSVPSLYIDVYAVSTNNLVGTTQANASGAWSLSLDNQTPGTYKVYAKGRNADGYVSVASSSWTYTVSVATSVVTLGLDPDAPFIFPNPIVDQATLKNVKRVTGVYDMNGRSYGVNWNPARQTIDLSNVSQGVYLIEVVNRKNKKEVLRVVKLE